MPAKLRLVREEAGPAEPIAGLVGRARAGDAEALSRILESVAAPMLRTTRGILGPQNADAQDAAQEAMIGFTRALEGFRGDCSILTYASRIAARTALHWRRRAHRQAEGQDALAADGADGTAASTNPDDPLLSIAARRRLALLRSMLDDLAPEQAEALMLRAVMGYSLKEVAAVSEVPVNTVRSRVRLAKLALLKRIDADPSRREIWELER